MGTPVALRALAVAALGLVLVAGCGKSEVRMAPIVWHGLAEGEAIARRDCKPALVFLHAQWSVADKELERETFPAQEVGLAMRGFVAIDIDVSDGDEPPAADALTRFGSLGVPTVIAVGDFDSYPSRSAGYANPNDLFRVNKYVDSKTLAAHLREAKREFERRGRCSARDAGARL